MNAKDFIETYGAAEAAKVAEAAGTNYAYFSQIAHGHRRPSVELAERLVAESSQRLSFVLLLKSPKRGKSQESQTNAAD